MIADKAKSFWCNLCGALLFFLKAKQNNQRIIQQQGCFFLFGLSLFTTKKKIYNDWLIKDYKIIIDKNAKKNILKALDKKGINEYTMFPDKKSSKKLEENIQKTVKKYQDMVNSV